MKKCSAVVGNWEEAPNIWLMVAKTHICWLSLHFSVHVVQLWLGCKNLPYCSYHDSSAVSSERIFQESCEFAVSVWNMPCFVLWNVKLYIHVTRPHFWPIILPRQYSLSLQGQASLMCSLFLTMFVLFLRLQTESRIQVMSNGAVHHQKMVCSRTTKYVQRQQLIKRTKFIS